MIKAMADKAKATIVAHRTYDYTSHRPESNPPSHESIVANCWAWACMQKKKKLTYDEAYSKYVSVGPQSNITPTNVFLPG
jgi:hypothetical protein